MIGALIARTPRRVHPENVGEGRTCALGQEKTPEVGCFRIWRFVVVAYRDEICRDFRAFLLARRASFEVALFETLSIILKLDDSSSSA
jgi:hypothetical protein